jgi:G:T-mismatch repair DNA endonuclease (very short patch repair protein)
MMSRITRNAISFALLVVALIGLGVQYREIREDIPGPHTLIVAAYIAVVIYASASIVLRMRGARG